MGNVRMRAEQINYGATNVKVALDDLDPKDLIALSARMDTIEAWKATVKAEEKSGSSVEFTNALAIKAVAVSAEIEPIQDLHGYDHPWVGGAGKNIFNVNGTYTDNNVTHTVVNDNLILTPTTNESGWKQSIIYVPIKLNESYTISLDNITCPDNYEPKVYVYHGSDTIGELNKTRLSDNFTVTSGDTEIWLLFRASQTGTPQTTDTFTFEKPMIRLSSTSAGYAPYKNECPISGRTAVTITDYDSESNTATVTIQLGQTVYGGTLNVTTGELTLNKASGEKTITKIYQRSGNANCDFAVFQLPDDILYHGNMSEMLCNKGYYSNAVNFDSATLGCILAYDSPNREYAIAMPKGYTLEQAQSYYGTIQICDVLATPTTIQLTANQLQMLKGYNRASADTGDITVKAYTGSAWGGDTV